MVAKELKTACAYCGGILNQLVGIRPEENITSCMHCGHQVSTYKDMNGDIKHNECGGYGTYHIHYKNGETTFGYFKSSITGQVVERFMNFINEDPSIDIPSCNLIRFEKGRLHALVGQVPPLYEKEDTYRKAGASYA